LVSCCCSRWVLRSRPVKEKRHQKSRRSISIQSFCLLASQSGWNCCGMSLQPRHHQRRQSLLQTRLSPSAAACNFGLKTQNHPNRCHAEMDMRFAGIFDRIKFFDSKRIKRGRYYGNDLTLDILEWRKMAGRRLFHERVKGMVL
jgi:hypothetical protein